MEFVKRNYKTILFALLVFMGLFGIVRGVFGSRLTALSEERDMKREQLEAHETLIGQEGQYKKLLDPLKFQAAAGQNGEAALQDWVNELLRFASENGMVFEKVEPDKLRTKNKDQAMRINLAFRGEVQKLTYFLQYLMRVNPLANVERMKISQTEEKKDYLYELVLGKGLS
ncbi:MAG: hypothetical protein V1882_02140 [Candidatus Omnitrophota bacterium]